MKKTVFSFLLCIHCDADSYSFSYSLGDDGEPVYMGTMGTRYLSEKVQGGFTGCLFGLYCVSAQETAVAEFESIVENRN